MIEELQTLERFQPRHPSINVSKISSFEFFVRKLYKPKEDIEHFYQLTALALIMSSDRRVSPLLVGNEYFEKPLLTDLKYCLRNVQRIDLDFLRLAFRFTRFSFRGAENYNADRREI